MGIQELILWHAKQEGIDQGIEKGIEKGIEQHIFDVVANILKSFPEWEDEKIADLAGTTAESVARIRSGGK
jgi:hypothetical protein